MQPVAPCSRALPPATLIRPPRRRNWAYNRWQSKARGFPEYMGMLPASLMAEEMELQGEHQVRAMITVAGNPVLSVPNGKRIHAPMDNLDFMVAFDFYLNETTSQADIIIPSTTQLEHSNYDFLFAATCVRNFAQYSPQVFEPEPGALEQWEIINEVTARMNGMARSDLEGMMLDGLIDQTLANSDELGALSPTTSSRQRRSRGPEQLTRHHAARRPLRRQIPSAMGSRWTRLKRRHTVSTWALYNRACPNCWQRRTSASTRAHADHRRPGAATNGP